MKRREFVAGAGLLLAMPAAPLDAAPPDDEAALKQAINDYYSIYYRARDKEKDRSLLADDYLLLENGEIMNADDDIGLIPKPGDLYERTDAFDFRQIKVEGDNAWMVYFLSSVITDRNGTANRRWLESAVFRRSGSRWLIGLLHSTRLGNRAATSRTLTASSDRNRS
jgi:ketosteroid isomerase-like protein